MHHARQFDIADIEPTPLHQPIEVRPRHRSCRYRNSAGRAPKAGLRFTGPDVMPCARRVRARLTRPRRQSPDSRCSGNNCRKDAREFARDRASEFCFSRSCAAISIAGVQKPHCSALRSRNAACRSAISPLSDSPSIVSTDASSRLHRQHQAGAHDLAVNAHRARAANAVLAADMRAGQFQMLAQKICQIKPRQHESIDTLAVDVERNGDGSRQVSAPASSSGRESNAATHRDNNTFARCRRMAGVA